MAKSSNNAFGDEEHPTAKRDVLDAVDLANAANKTQELNPRALLGDKLDAEPAVRQTTSGTRAVVTADDIEKFKRSKADPPKVEALETGEVEVEAADAEAEAGAEVEVEVDAPARSRLVITPAMLVFAVFVALLVGFFVGRLR